MLAYACLPWQIRACSRLTRAHAVYAAWFYVSTSSIDYADQQCNGDLAILDR